MTQKLRQLAPNFEVRPPDADGDIWLILHGNGTTGKGAINLGKPERITAQVAIRLEEDRKDALAIPPLRGAQDPESAGEMLTRLGTNGVLWAEEFCKTSVSLGYGELDEGWVIGWFANAIELAKSLVLGDLGGKIQNMVDIQCSPGNVDVNEYMRGYANGLILAMSCIDNREPDFIEAPPGE